MDAITSVLFTVCEEIDTGEHFANSAYQRNSRDMPYGTTAGACVHIRYSRNI